VGHHPWVEVVAVVQRLEEVEDPHREAEEEVDLQSQEEEAEDRQVEERARQQGQQAQEAVSQRVLPLAYRLAL